jgi:hypothetical protein
MMFVGVYMCGGGGGVCVCVCVCVCMTRRFVDKTIFSKVESWDGRVPKQVILAAKPSSQGLSSALSEQRAFSDGIANLNTI